MTQKYTLIKRREDYIYVLSQKDDGSIRYRPVNQLRQLHATIKMMSPGYARRLAAEESDIEYIAVTGKYTIKDDVYKRQKQNRFVLRNSNNEFLLTNQKLGQRKSFKANDVLVRTSQSMRKLQTLYSDLHLFQITGPNSLRLVRQRNIKKSLLDE